MKEKELRNRISREERKALAAAETFKRKTVSFYRYVKITDPQAFRDTLFSEWEALNCFGRIYIANEGINAQMNVPEHNWEKFLQNLESHSELASVPLKIAVEEPKTSFYKLTIKVREKIVADGLDDSTFDPSDTGRHLSAEEWNELLAREDAICVDMRNQYESEIGHFEGAITPDVDTFKEELPKVKEMLTGKEDKPVLLYCTGGIRCEKASAYLKHHGFKNVCQLNGGIIEYAHQAKQKGLDCKFKGKNFVFDERTAERITDDVIAHCHQCGETCDEHTNCENAACNLLFIQCEGCKEKFSGCCSEQCKEIAALPVEEQKEYRRKCCSKFNRKPYSCSVRPKEAIGAE